MLLKLKPISLELRACAKKSHRGSPVLPVWQVRKDICVFKHLPTDVKNKDTLGVVGNLIFELTIRIIKI